MPDNTQYKFNVIQSGVKQGSSTIFGYAQTYILDKSIRS